MGGAAARRSPMRILVFNCGSSSLKFALFDKAESEHPTAPARGEFEEIGSGQSQLTITVGGSTSRSSSNARDHAAAARETWAAIGDAVHGASIDAVAHRVVHGGAHVVAPTIIDGNVLQELNDATRFAPLHNPPALATIDAVGQLLGKVPQVVVTDTAFHQTIPEVARNYPIPAELAEHFEIRRFGFHGIGHAWMTERYATLTNQPAARVNLITLQLGAGCSATAIRSGKSIDTSMGLTPLEGLMMATRSGDIDPGIFRYLADAANLGPGQVENLLNHQSGLIGVAGESSDMRELLRREARGDERAALAVAMFCYRVRKYIGAYLTIPGSTEALVFGGGIGEHAAPIRARICTGLASLGIELDTDRNETTVGTEGQISTDQSRITVWVIPVREELYIARATAHLLQSSKA